MKANPMEVGELISFYRRQADMTIDELAEKSGVPKGTLNKIIGGVTKAPTLDTMKALAKALGKRLADFEDEPDYANLISLSEKTHIQKYRLLDSHGKDLVDLVLDKETERMEAEAAARKAREAMEAGMIAPPTPTPPIASQPYPELDLTAQVAKLERQNQELVAEITAMREQERKMPQEMTDEELRAELDRQLLEEKIRAENGVVSGPTSSDTATG